MEKQINTSIGNSMEMGDLYHFLAELYGEKYYEIIREQFCKVEDLQAIDNKEKILKELGLPLGVRKKIIISLKTQERKSGGFRVEEKEPNYNNNTKKERKGKTIHLQHPSYSPHTSTSNRHPRGGSMIRRRGRLTSIGELTISPPVVIAKPHSISAINIPTLQTKKKSNKKKKSKNKHKNTSSSSSSSSSSRLFSEERILFPKVEDITTKVLFDEPATSAILRFADIDEKTNEWVLKWGKQTHTRRPIAAASLGKVIERLIDSTLAEVPPSKEDITRFENEQMLTRVAEGSRSKIAAVLGAGDGHDGSTHNNNNNNSNNNNNNNKGISRRKTLMRSTSPRHQSSISPSSSTRKLSFRSAFLLTYKELFPPLDLMKLLVKRYNTYPKERKKTARLATNHSLTQLGVHLTFFTWIRDHVSDFLDTRSEIYFLDRVIGRHGIFRGEYARMLMSEMNTAHQHLRTARFGRLPSTGTLPNSPLSPESPSVWLSWKSGDLAKQMTLIEHALLRDIKREDWLRGRWAKDKRAPSIAAVLNHVNVMALWIASSIVRAENEVLRNQLALKFLRVAQHCCRLNNFCTAMEINTALTNTAVARLLEDDVKASAERLNNLFSGFKRYGNYREALREATPPCVPHLLIYLSDLQIVEEVQETVLPGNLINCEKLQQLANIIHQIEFFQAQTYQLRSILPLEYFLLHPPKYIPDANELYQESITIRPIRSMNESIVRKSMK